MNLLLPHPSFAKLMWTFPTTFLIVPTLFYGREQWLGRWESNGLVHQNTWVPPRFMADSQYDFQQVWFLHLKSGSYVPPRSTGMWFKTWWHFKTNTPSNSDEKEHTHNLGKSQVKPGSKPHTPMPPQQYSRTGGRRSLSSAMELQRRWHGTHLTRCTPPARSCTRPARSCHVQCEKGTCRAPYWHIDVNEPFLPNS